MAVDIEKQRARWRRNKRDERMNKLSTGKHLSPEFLSAVIAERDRRITETPRVGYLWRRGVYFKDGSWEKAIAFLADVWAADYCLKAELGESNAKPKRVIEWLCIYGLDHGYTQSSLRKLIYQARARIKLLEKLSAWYEHRDVWWPPFEYRRPRRGKNKRHSIELDP